MDFHHVSNHFLKNNILELWHWGRLLRPLDCKEIQAVHPQGNQSWIWCWSWNSNTLAMWCEEPTHWKRHWCWERLKAGGEGDNRGQDCWMASPTRWTWVWVNSGSLDREAWHAAVHGVTKSRTWLSNWTEPASETVDLTREPEVKEATGEWSPRNQ